MRAPGSGACSDQGQTFTATCDSLKRKPCVEHDSCRWVAKQCINPGPPGCEATVPGKLKKPTGKLTVDLDSDATCADCRQACSDGGAAAFKYRAKRRGSQ